MSLKSTTLTEEQEFELSLQMDQYSMINIGFKEDDSIIDIIEEYKEEFQNSDYNNYYDFLIDTLDSEFKNELYKDLDK